MSRDRRYEQIWTELLKRRKLSVRASPKVHEKIKKAVFKEKDLDVENRKKWRLEGKSEGDLLHFLLRPKVNLLEI